MSDKTRYAELCDGCRAEMPGPHDNAWCAVTTTTPGVVRENEEAVEEQKAD